MGNAPQAPGSAAAPPRKPQTRKLTEEERAEMKRIMTAPAEHFVATLDDAYRARLVKRRPLEPERGADHGVLVPPTTREARDLVFLDDARERPTTDVDPGGLAAS